MPCHGLNLCAVVVASCMAQALAGAAQPKGAGKFTAAIQKTIQQEIASLDNLYKHLHTHPELSYEEEQTAARMAKELQALGFEVTTRVGGHGVVGVLKNGRGPTVLVRTDM